MQIQKDVLISLGKVLPYKFKKSIADRTKKTSDHVYNVFRGHYCDMAVVVCALEMLEDHYGTKGIFNQNDIESYICKKLKEWG